MLKPIVVKKFVSPKNVSTEPTVLSPERDAAQTIGAMSGSLPGTWWSVWWKGRAHNTRYFLGHVEGTQSEAIRKAKEYYPKARGQMMLELVAVNPTHEFANQLQDERDRNGGSWPTDVLPSSLPKVEEDLPEV